MNVYEYTNNLMESLVENTYKNNGILEIYDDKVGALRLAREYGCGLRDFNVKCQDDIISESYMLICYRYYQCNPPVEFNEWCSAVCSKINKEVS